MWIGIGWQKVTQQEAKDKCNLIKYFFNGAPFEIDARKAMDVINYAVEFHKTTFTSSKGVNSIDHDPTIDFDMGLADWPALPEYCIRGIARPVEDAIGYVEDTDIQTGRVSSGDRRSPSPHSDHLDETAAGREADDVNRRSPCSEVIHTDAKGRVTIDDDCVNVPQYDYTAPEFMRDWRSDEDAKSRAR
jgi:hypothetical protein